MKKGCPSGRPFLLGKLHNVRERTFSLRELFRLYEIFFQKISTTFSSLFRHTEYETRKLPAFAFSFHSVGVRRLELPCLSAYGPEPYVSTNFTIRPKIGLYLLSRKSKINALCYYGAHARVVELVDTQDLKFCGPKGPRGFESRPGYHCKSWVLCPAFTMV